MLLKIKQISIFVLVITVFSGCGGSYFDRGYYYTPSYGNGYVDKKSNYVPKKTNIPNKVGTNMRNSKAMHRATMRPYIVFGKKYHPTVAHVYDKFTGVASWYGPDFHAKKTSNGEVYNMYAMTAAHKTLPMNTMVRVDNLENGLSTVVRVNDRGPFVKQRIIDLSNAAAHKIDMVKKGTAKVRLTVLGFQGKIATTFEEKQEVSSVGNYYIQVGVFRKTAGARSTKRKFDMILDSDKYKVVLKDGILKGNKIKRVWISGFRSEEEAKDFKEMNNLQGSMLIAQ
ncbi:MAG: septal ring lytic transglycosylase RlpA family protein [Campylobacterota bacterium]|nr:septal ring lytic transglycosylase RlpA family protein [Campylobacterota bacterium]